MSSLTLDVVMIFFNFELYEGMLKLSSEVGRLLPA